MRGGAGGGVPARILFEAVPPKGYTRVESQSLPEGEVRVMGVKVQDRNPGKGA